MYKKTFFIIYSVLFLFHFSFEGSTSITTYVWKVAEISFNETQDGIKPFSAHKKISRDLNVVT